jgi:hypothetical protein
MHESISGAVSETVEPLTLEDIARQDAARARQRESQKLHNRARRGTSNGRVWGYSTGGTGKRARRRK